MAGRPLRHLRGGTLARFALLGLASVAVNLAVVAALRELAGLAAATAGAAGYVTVLVMNFVLARRHVFRSDGDWRGQAWRFAVVQAATRMAEYGAFLVLVYGLGARYAMAIVLVAAAFFLLKFAIYRHFVFARAVPERSVTS